MKNSREQVAEEIFQGAAQKFWLEQGDSKNNLGSKKKLIWGTVREKNQGAGRWGLNFEGGQN